MKEGTFKKNLNSIEDTLKRIFKSEKNEALDEDEEITLGEEEIEKSEDEINEEYTDEIEEDDFEDEPIDVKEEEMEEEEIEKSEDEIEEDEIEKSEDEEDGTFLTEAEMVAKVMESVQPELDRINSQLASLLKVVGKTTEAVEKSIKTTSKENTNFAKSVNSINKRLNNISKMRKSVLSTKDININEKYEKQDIDINTLSKAQVATILLDAYEAGNKAVSDVDITNAELGYPISEQATEILRKSINR